MLGVIAVQQPVFFSRASVYFFAPSSTVNPNVLRVASLDLVTAAGVVGKRVNGTKTLTGTASMEVTLFGRGILDGSSVMLPDNGGQWSVSFNRQELDVQVVAATPEEVTRRQSELFAQIRLELDALQTELEVPAANLITTEIVPQKPAVLAITGERRRAQVMTLILGSTLTLLAIGSVELTGRIRRRQFAQGI
ncbi:hypothetical protein [Microbacterium aurum]